MRLRSFLSNSEANSLCHWKQTLLSSLPHWLLPLWLRQNPYPNPPDLFPPLWTMILSRIVGMHNCSPINILMQRVFTIEHHVHHWFLTSSIIVATNLTDTSLRSNNIASFPLFPLSYFQTCLHKLRQSNQSYFHPRGFSFSFPIGYKMDLHSIDHLFPRHCFQRKIVGNPKHGNHSSCLVFFPR